MLRQRSNVEMGTFASHVANSSFDPAPRQHVLLRVCGSEFCSFDIDKISVPIGIYLMISSHALCRPLMFLVLVLLFCCARGTATAQTWEPVSTGFTTEILVSTSGGNTSAKVRLTFPNTGYRVIDWGAVARNDGEFSVDARVERWTGLSGQAITTLEHTYALGTLAPGEYSFTVKIYGSVARTVQFSIDMAATLVPRLLTEENTERAIALESVTLMREPFSLISTHNFSSDHLTRVMLFATDIELGQGEGVSTVTAQAEDSGQKTYPLTVEYVGKVPNLDGLIQVIIKLPAEVESTGDMWISINVRGIVSNRVLISIKPSESGYH
jgi:uncharacterized protein (TIGR03437 family)